MTITEARQHYGALARYLRRRRLVAVENGDLGDVVAEYDAMIDHLAALGAVMAQAITAGVLVEDPPPAHQPAPVFQQPPLLDIPDPVKYG
jgi:hypothetical protein